ncbi:hypothetical protein SAMN04488009_2046 [Maribacter sedimenticola]|uniref:Uncharacterized protein n=1 Tax=Maribacter sedimenticola TaxID=228956 RepID=A0ABY1SGY9_9FLAO|nr:hypothetical protein SAMN04488009_2046 [Maribacter sedimenticola]
MQRNKEYELCIAKEIKDIITPNFVLNTKDLILCTFYLILKT